jgi:uncharacterized DUF497 family protein
MRVSIVVQGDFEWDGDKAESNRAKHGVSFEEAATVFADGAAVFIEDSTHADRFIVIGMSAAPRVLFVVHVIRGERERIVSARPATATEERLYAPAP